MNNIAKGFFRCASVYAFCGMALGLYMSVTEDFTERPVHAHMIVAGFVLSLVFTLFYSLLPALAQHRLATLHLWLYGSSLTALLVGLFFLLQGAMWLGPVVGIASIAFAASVMMFFWIGWKAV
jgi:hypothetical protein